MATSKFLQIPAMPQIPPRPDFIADREVRDWCERTRIWADELQTMLDSIFTKSGAALGLHHATHEHDGADEIPITELDGLTAAQVVYGAADGKIGQEAALAWDAANDTLALILGAGNIGFDAISSVANVPSSFRATNYENTNNLYRPAVSLRRARGTSSIPTAATLNDYLGSYVFQGHNGTSFLTGARIDAWAMENWSGTQRGTVLNFCLVPSGSTVVTDVMRLLQTGDLALLAGAKLLLDGVAGTGDTYLIGHPGGVANTVALVLGGTTAFTASIAGGKTVLTF